MKPESKMYSTEVGGQPFTFETGKLAAQAGGAVTVRVGDNIVFAAATMGDEPREGQDFFPLTVEYEEKLYAGGRIPGSYFRREGRPPAEAVLTARLTDRPLRPLFQQDMRNEVQVIMSSISSDMELPLDVLAVNAASAALMISDIPWGGPVGCVRVGRIDGQLVVNPTYAQLDQSDIDLRIAGTRDAILMVECGANEVKEEDMVAALAFGHQAIQPIIDLQLQMAAETGKAKREVPLFSIDQALVEQVSAKFGSKLVETLNAPLAKEAFNDSMKALEAEAVEAFVTPEEPEKAGKVKEAFHEVMKQAVRSRILFDKKRLDGRSVDEIRPIWCEVGLSPRAHGAGLFTRGETQVLTLATLGTPKEAQELDSLSP
ncbi:MAG: polyribonucleotide nucleotidyltransferase, partial [bacterium]